MGSLFDSNVYQRRNVTPWARVNVESFMRDAALNGGWEGEPFKRDSVLTCRYRHDVATRLWWSLVWCGEDGKQHEVSASDLDLLMWRAAEVEMTNRERAKRELQKGGQ